MNFQQLLSKMVELDQPKTESQIADECGMPPTMGQSPMSMEKPDTPPPSMSVNLNAQGMDDIESLMKLMTKVNPDMINQPTGGMPPMPGVATAMPAISAIGDLGNLDAGPLKMLPDFGAEPEGHSEPDADNMGGPSDMDADNDNKPGGEMDRPSELDMDKDKKDKDEAFGNSVDGSSPEYMDMDAAIPDGDDLHKQKTMHRAAAGGDNPMKAEGTDLRAQIRAELQQRLAEAKGAK